MRWGDSGEWGKRRETGPGKTHEENLWENVNGEGPLCLNQNIWVLCMKPRGWFSKVHRQPQAQLGRQQICLHHSLLCLFSSNTKAGHPSTQQSPRSSKKSTIFTPTPPPRFALLCLLVQRAPSQTLSPTWQTSHGAGTFFLGLIHTNQSVLKEINPEYSLEGLMLKLKLQYFDLLMWKAGSLEKTLMLGKIEGRMRRGQQRMRWLDGITDLM